MDFQKKTPISPPSQKKIEDNEQTKENKLWYQDPKRQPEEAKDI